jgi:stromal interaction molecule 1
MFSHFTKLNIPLILFQKELERARLEQACVTSEKQNLERQLQQQGGDHTELHTSYSDLEVSQLKAEIEVCVISKFHIPVEFEI